MEVDFSQQRNQLLRDIEVQSQALLAKKNELNLRENNLREKEHRANQLHELNSRKLNELNLKEQQIEAETVRRLETYKQNTLSQMQQQREQLQLRLKMVEQEYSRVKAIKGDLDFIINQKESLALEKEQLEKQVIFYKERNQQREAIL